MYACTDVIDQKCDYDERLYYKESEYWDTPKLRMECLGLVSCTEPLSAVPSPFRSNCSDDSRPGTTRDLVLLGGLGVDKNKTS